MSNQMKKTGEKYDGKDVYIHKISGNKAVLLEGYFCSVWGLQNKVKHWCVGEAKENDLALIPDGYRTKEVKVQKDMIEDLVKFINEARKQTGTELRIASGFRSFGNPSRKDGQSNVNIFSMAPSGFSQHHSGYAVDFDPIDGKKWEKGSYPKISSILDKIAPNHGFIRTFNPDTANNANNKFGKLILEPWHFCYVRGKNRHLLYNTI